MSSPRESHPQALAQPGVKSLDSSGSYYPPCCARIQWAKPRPLMSGAPWTINVRKYVSPRLVMPSNSGLSPLECCLGTRPSQAANCRALLPKHLASPIQATSAADHDRPHPGNLRKPPTNRSHDAKL